MKRDVKKKPNSEEFSSLNGFFSKIIDNQNKSHKAKIENKLRSIAISINKQNSQTYSSQKKKEQKDKISNYFASFYKSSNKSSSIRIVNNAFESNSNNLKTCPQISYNEFLITKESDDSYVSEPPFEKPCEEYIDEFPEVLKSEYFISEKNYLIATYRSNEKESFISDFSNLKEIGLSSKGESKTKNFNKNLISPLREKNDYLNSRICKINLQQKYDSYLDYGFVSTKNKDSKKSYLLKKTNNKENIFKF